MDAGLRLRGMPRRKVLSLLTSAARCAAERNVELKADFEPLRMLLCNTYVTSSR